MDENPLAKMKINDTVLVKKGLCQDKTGIVEKIFTYKGKPLYFVKCKVPVNYSESGYDIFYTTIDEKDAEVIVNN